jgi:type II secretory pathway pseudopilin PulG
MASYAHAHPTDYLKAYRERAVTNDPEYRADGIAERGRLLLDKEWDYLHLLTVEPKTDGVDGAGAFPFVSWALVALLIPGTAICFRRWRSPPHAFLIIAAVVIGTGPALTNEVVFRRTLCLTPLLAVIAVLPLAWLWQRARGNRTAMLAAGGFIVLALAGTAAVDLTRYFTTYDNDEYVNWIYSTALRDASEFMARLPDQPYVYFYADRWSFNYRPRAFLAPNVHGEDRSAEFGHFRIDPDRSQDVVYLFFPPYLDQLQTVEHNYTGGTPFEKHDDNGVVEYSAYLLPQLPGAPRPVATPTPESSAGADRDEIRMGNLASIRRALTQYYAEHGSYPNTGGAVQTLCVQPNSDAACVLRQVLDPLPTGPLDNPPANGYWYSSDGTTFVAYSLRESRLYSACPERPAALQNLSSALCVEGP